MQGKQKPDLDKIEKLVIKAAKAFVKDSKEFLATVKTWDKKEVSIKKDTGIDFKVQQFTDNINSVEALIPLSSARLTEILLGVTPRPVEEIEIGPPPPTKEKEEEEKEEAVPPACESEFAFFLHDSSSVNFYSHHEE